MNRHGKLAFLLAILASSPLYTYAGEAGLGSDKGKSYGIAFFGVFTLLTLFLTYRASRRTKSVGDFFATKGISGWQNGLAIAGDFISAASFLGGTGLAFYAGFDSVFFMVASVAGWPLLILISDRLRNLGKYTFVDVIAYRLDGGPVRSLAAAATLLIVLQFLIIQMIGSGRLIELVFGLPYDWALVIIGTLMMVYVLFGGMLAATWIQSTKAVLLVAGLVILVPLVLSRFDFDIGRIISEAASAHPRRASIFTPVGISKDPIGWISLGLGQVFGLLGLPHLLMRFFTVKDASTARRSAVIAFAIFACFTLAITVLGFAAIPLLTNNPDFLGADGKLAGGVNMVSLHLSRLAGGDILYGYLSAVIFATILAAVAGLMISGTSAVSHDLYAGVLKKGKANEKAVMRCSRLTIVILGTAAALLATRFGSESLPLLVALAFSISASVNFPLLILTMYWKGMTTRGAIVGGTIGLASAVTLIVLGPTVWVVGFHHAKPIAPLGNPTIFSMPLAFLTCWFFSVTDRSVRASRERAKFDEQEFRSTTGLGIEAAANH